jgi:hypothetical protein
MLGVAIGTFKQVFLPAIDTFKQTWCILRRCARQPSERKAVR